MNQKEIEIFRKLDDKLYDVNKNKTYKHLFSKLDKNINNKFAQDFIDKLASWYFIKYSNQYVKLYLNEEYDKIDYTQEEIMSIDKLIVRLNKVIPVDNKNALLFYKQLIVMAGWKLIYYDNTVPNFGYFRACKMFDEFNNKFNLGLNANIYDYIINLDYSDKNLEIKKLLEQKREKDKKEKNLEKRKTSKVRRLFRR